MIKFLIQFHDPFSFTPLCGQMPRQKWIGKLDRKLDRPFQKIGSPNFWPNHMIQFYDPISHPAAQPATGPIVWTPPGASEMGTRRGSTQYNGSPAWRVGGGGFAPKRTARDQESTNLRWEFAFWCPHIFGSDAAPKKSVSIHTMTY